jgi:hypothetical protein
MDNTNRVKRLQISGELIRSWLIEGEHEVHYKVVRDALPHDAEIINARVDWERNPNVIDLIIRSESFPEVDRLDQIPLLDIKMERVRPILYRAS